MPSRLRRPPWEYASGGGAPGRDSAPAQHGSTRVESGEAAFKIDDEVGNEAAAPWGTSEDAAPAQPAVSSAPDGVVSPRATAHEAGPATASVDLEGNSDMEEWVMAAGYEAPGCWQEAAPEDDTTEAALHHADDQQQRQAEPGPGQAFGLASSGSHPGSTLPPQDEDDFQGMEMAGAPEDELLRSRDPVFASVDGMVGNWEFEKGTGGEDLRAAAQAEMVLDEDYTSLLAELQQVEVAAGVHSKPTGSDAGEAGAGAGDADAK